MNSMSEIAVEKSFATQIVQAIAWRSGSQVIAQLIMWAATFFVIRILDPRDYGLFAMTQSVLVFLSLLNGQEFTASLIRAPELTKTLIRQVFGILVLLNGGIALAQVLIAPLAAQYFHTPMVAHLLTAQAALYLATPFVALPSALLSRQLNYKVQAKVNLASALIGAGTSLGCALAGFGVWTLVIAPMCVIWSRALGMTLAARLGVLPTFRLKGAGSIVWFGGAMLLSSLLWLFQTQSDVIIGGRSLDARHLGLYAEALFLAQIVTSKFVPPLNDVAFSAYARLQGNRETTGHAFAKSVRLIMFGALPFYVGLALVAGPFVDVVLGPKWDDATPIVRLLAVAMPFLTVQVLFAPATTALGHPRLQVWGAAMGALIMPVGFAIGVRYGAVGMAWSWVIGAPIHMMLTAAFSMPVIGTSARALLRAVMPAATASAGMAAAVLATSDLIAGMAPLPTLAILVAVGVAVYGGLVLVVARPIIGEFANLIARRGAVA
jgi:O-antigen/teichoic acid export membrane protein